MISSILLSVALTFTQADAEFAYRTTGDFVSSCTPRDAGTVRGRIAANYILDAASAVGADVRLDRFEADTPKGKKKFTNLESVFCTNPSLPWVILISHYDTKPGVKCPGANDGASTTALLIAMAKVLCDWTTPSGNVMLLWTDGEECVSGYGPNDGLWGARRAVERLSEANRDVKAVICLDMLGDRDLQISLPANTSPALRKIVHFAAKRTGLESKVKDIQELVTDDHVPFVNAGYKAVNLIDFEYGSEPGKNDYWHTPNDTIDKISVQSLLQSGQIVAEIINLLSPEAKKEAEARSAKDEEVKAAKKATKKAKVTKETPEKVEEVAVATTEEKVEEVATEKEIVVEEKSDEKKDEVATEETIEVVEEKPAEVATEESADAIDEILGEVDKDEKTEKSEDAVESADGEEK